LGSIKVILSEELEKDFRDEVYKLMGMKKGNITLAIEEAVTDWVQKQRKKRSEASKKAWEKRREVK